MANILIVDDNDAVSPFAEADGQARPVASTAVRFAALWHSKASATSFRPMARNSLESNRRTQASSTIVVPPVAPNPTNESPKDAEPMQVSENVEVKDGATTGGADLTV